MFHFILPKFIFNIERWKWNNEYRVYVSNMGHFKDGHKNSLPFLISDRGYILIKTSCGFKRAHRLVMLTWVPIPDAENLTVDHLDHNKRNNALSNLEWVTGEENQRRADRDLFKEIPKNENKEIFCTKESRTFKNINDAAEWLMNNKFCNPDMNEKTEERIVNHIKLAIERGTSYGRYHWAIKELLFMSVYLISDTHFGHKNIISYCNRPFSSVEEMDKTLIKNWNNVVKRDDIVYHLGDFAFGNKEFIQEIVLQLNGDIRLILGNHDTCSIQFYYDCGFNRVYDQPIVINEYFILTHRPIEPIDEKGIYANFYGHVHDDPRFKEATARSFNVSSDNIGFMPILFEDAVVKMEEKEDEN